MQRDYSCYVIIKMFIIIEDPAHLGTIQMALLISFVCDFGFCSILSRIFDKFAHFNQILYEYRYSNIEELSTLSTDILGEKVRSEKTSS